MVGFISHDLCSLHEMGAGHPECPQRLQAIKAQLQHSGLWEKLHHFTARAASDEQILRAHSEAHLHRLKTLKAQGGASVQVDPDTSMNPHSLAAAYHAAGSGVQALELLLSAKESSVFCAVRPPGHHAEYATAMGFCLFNSVAVTALQALKNPAIERVAIVDFDVHHGNGTVDIFKDDPRVMVCSTFQHPFYPHRYYDIEREHIVLSPLPAGTGSETYRQVFERDCLPAITAHQPQLFLVSAGFDAHREDPLGGLCLEDEDYAWLAEQIIILANNSAEGRVISFLEGGYQLQALARSVESYLTVFCDSD